MSDYLLLSFSLYVYVIGCPICSDLLIMHNLCVILKHLCILSGAKRNSSMCSQSEEGFDRRRR